MVLQVQWGRGHFQLGVKQEVIHLSNTKNYICHCVICLVVLGSFLVLTDDVITAPPLPLFILLVRVSNLLSLARYCLTGTAN